MVAWQTMHCHQIDTAAFFQEIFYQKYECIGFPGGTKSHNSVKICG